MKPRIGKYILVLLLLLNLYLLGFFVAFERVSVLVGLNGDRKFYKDSPQSISIVTPTGSPKVKNVLYYLYYPVHFTLKEKELLFPVKDVDLFFNTGETE